MLDELSECIASENSVAESYEGRELGECIRRFARTLPERDCNIFLRRYFFTESVTDIAKRYGLRENSVAVILSRTRNKLKIYLKKEGYFDEKY